MYCVLQGMKWTATKWIHNKPVGVTAGWACLDMAFDIATYSSKLQTAFTRCLSHRPCNAVRGWLICLRFSLISPISSYPIPPFFHPIPSPLQYMGGYDALTRASGCEDIERDCKARAARGECESEAGMADLVGPGGMCR